MSNGFLSQEEIDSLLNGGTEADVSKDSEAEDLSDLEKDLLGEIGNISMGSASTALSTIISQTVNITTPVVTVTNMTELKKSFEIPNIAVQVKYTSGIVGENLLVMKVTDAAVIANLMMGKDPKIPEDKKTLSEIELSAVSEAMNQMIGSSATSMATMFGREINISPPASSLWDDVATPLPKDMNDNDPIVKISFKLIIGDLVDSYIMQVLPMDTAKKIVSIMMGQEKEENPAQSSDNEKKDISPKPPEVPDKKQEESSGRKQEELGGKRQVEVHEASFQPLDNNSKTEPLPKNIDLILDVPLEVSVVLGRTKKNIRDILNFGTGSLIELDRLAEEPVEILINGKKVAYGEVVVVDENFGVRITNIVNNAERIKTLAK